MTVSFSLVRTASGSDRFLVANGDRTCKAWGE